MTSGPLGPNMLPVLGLDDQFKYDFSEWYALLAVVLIPAVCLGMLVAVLMKKEEEDQR